MTKHARIIGSMLALAVFTLMALMAPLELSACTRVRPDPTIVVGAPPIVWDSDPVGQGFASGLAGALALKWIEYTPQQFRIYYVFKPSDLAQSEVRSLSLEITASSSLTSNPSAPAVPLTATIQPLGQIGVYSIGVMYIQHLNRADQIITLAITPSLPGAAIWRLSPIHQLIVEPHAQTARGGLGAYPNAMPEAQWSPPVQAQFVSYVKVIIPGQPIAERTYVFVRSDDWATVQVITKAQYLALAGNENFTP